MRNISVLCVAFDLSSFFSRFFLLAFCFQIFSQFLICTRTNRLRHFAFPLKSKPQELKERFVWHRERFSWALPFSEGQTISLSYLRFFISIVRLRLRPRKWFLRTDKWITRFSHFQVSFVLIWTNFLFKLL